MFFVTLFVTAMLLAVNVGTDVYEASVGVPVVVTTWNFENATKRAWDILASDKGSSLDAVECGCAICEYERCSSTVGYGGSPDENGETTLDAMIMDGCTYAAGAVGALRRIKNAVGVARKVMDYTQHTFLVGDAATNFAISMGFVEEDLSTRESREMYECWKSNQCQPNFRKNVCPDPTKSCGPYTPVCHYPSCDRNNLGFGEHNHDTIGMIAIDCKHKVASATSTNGAKFKIPGRVGDSPVIGAGSFADSEVGGAAATGDGDIMMRFLPSFYTVEEMRKGATPDKATTKALKRIVAKYPRFVGAIVALRIDGKFGASCYGMDSFPFYVASESTRGPHLYHKKCIC